ncbi:hypothetical protein NEOLEDRAFT_1076393 [Neolentinus lepideus HHB14362 ss-1]|uniref:Mediator complex subunit 1 n=1 Tax=Neolentinus lepideus HHB14362 ss-1 TaxID=1314782 RepID=A0A165NUA0_9AGAM|nr:hypothetical protein NEOLEDRAFT_1076393 [Neolentinus lepideus HHB14362 ss-1]
MNDAETFLTALQKYATSDAFASNALHPFSTSSETSTSELRGLLDATSLLSQSLNLHATLPYSNPKLVSTLRQHANIQSTFHSSEQTIAQTIATLRKSHSKTAYVEDIPLDRSQVPSYCLARLEAWGTSAGMECFREEERDGKILLVVGGKVLVVDVEVSLDRTSADNPVLHLSNVKTSYAVPSASVGTGNAVGSTSLDIFLTEVIKRFLAEAQKPEERQDYAETARLGTVVAKSFEYLMSLDALAAKEGDSGLRWFGEVDRLASTIGGLTKSEAEAVSRSLSLNPMPLDIFLLRAHSLPLPYTTSPTMSFLVHISPFSYLTLLRTCIIHREPLSTSVTVDIPLPQLRSYLNSQPKPPGVTVASLHLVQEDQPQILMADDSMSMGIPAFLSVRPMFPLLSSPEETAYEFPVPEAAPHTQRQNYRWELDFTEGGRVRGVVITQTRMHEIETIVSPLGGIAAAGMEGMRMMSFGEGSWIDLLLNPNAPTLISPERYTAVYASPTRVHPDLQLRLTAPEEPGFFLERVQVRNMKEVWGILEVVKEQAWLNQILLGCEWSPEGLAHPGKLEFEDDDVEVTEDDLQAVLNGTITPRKIPVNVYVPSSTDPDPAHHPLYDSSLSTFQSLSRPRIVTTSPERPPISGLMEITVSYQPEKEKGVAVSVVGALGSELDVGVMEEICRRGGVLGLPGRLWSSGGAVGR